jgi:hypothetical protein
MWKEAYQITSLSVSVRVCVCVSPTNNFWTVRSIFMKFGRKVTPSKQTSMPHFNLASSAIPKWLTFKILRWAQLLNRLVELDEILYGGDDIEDDLDSILLKAVASTVTKWRTFKLLRCAQLSNRLMGLDEILFGFRENRHISCSQNFLFLPHTLVYAILCYEFHTLFRF